MLKKTLYIIIILTSLVCFTLIATADMQSTNYRIPASVLSSGGTTMDSASYQMTATIGQSSCIGLSSRRSYIDYAGFWQPSKLEIKRRAMPWLALLLLDDGDYYEEYRNYFTNNPKIARSSINQFDQETLGYFWNYIEQMETIGEIRIDEPLESQNCIEPTECPYIYPTDMEIKKILAAKAAHSIWLDKNKKLPWELDSYEEDELKGLFDKDVLFDQAINGYRFLSVVDYSPSPIYRYARDSNLIQADKLNTVYKVLDDLRTTDEKMSFLHGSSSYPSDFRRTAYTLFDALTTYSDRGYASPRVARNGCQSMSRIMLGLLRSVNIPGEEKHGAEWYDGGHSSAVWPAIERVLPHGDDIYGGTLKATPSEKLLPTFEFYEDSQNTNVCGTDKTCLSRRHKALLAIMYPDRWTTARCCNPIAYGYASCEDYLSTQYKDYLTDEEIKNASDEITIYCE